ncbi:hypothetical protein ES703_00374 [subsurface metagenome]
MIKKWYHSKTFWVMAISLVASIITGITGETWLDGDIQVAILSLIGLILRLITNQGLRK